MTFVDAAIELLRREGGPLSVEVLAERATSEGLLKRPSKNPLSAMKTRLTVELKKGADSRIVKFEDGMFALVGEEEAGELEVAAEPKDAAAAEEPGEQSGRRSRRRRRRGNNGVSEDRDEARAEVAAEDRDDEPGDDEPAEDEDDDEEIPPEQRRREIEPSTPEEAELAEIYAGETDFAAAAERSEYSDELTADEDRPMLPAIKAERRGRRGREGRGRDRDRDRDRGRDRKDRGRGKDRDRARDRDRDRERDRDTDGERDGSRRDSSAPAERGESAVAASDLIGQLAEILADGNERSLPWSQAASLLRKRAGRSESVEDLAELLRRAVLIEEATSARLQVSPRVCTRGRDRLTLGRRESAELHPLLSRMEDEVKVALTHKLSALAGRKLETLVAAFLEHNGYAEIEWIKRVTPSSYAVATAPGGESILVSARSGAKPVDRRGVGELRAGITAKKLRSGLLVAPQPLSPEARNELAKEGPPIAVRCGPELVAALVDAGLGVATRTFAVRSVDDGFFDRL
jgi:hypothetical protein